MVGWNVLGVCMSAALEGLWKARTQGKLFFNSEINDIALVNNDLSNRPGVAGRFYTHLCHRLIRSVSPSVILFLQFVKTS